MLLSRGKPTPKKQLLRSSLAGLVFIASTSGHLALAATTTAPSPKQPAIAEEVESTRAQRARQAVATRSDAIAQWLDAFFDVPDVEAETARTRLELRQSVDFSAREDTEARTRLSAKVKLPSLSRRVSLTFRGNDEDEYADRGAYELDRDAGDSLDDPSLGLQYVFKEESKYHSSFSVGTRLDNPSVNFGPRFRYQHQLSKNWRGRYTQRILYDTDEGWESSTRLEFDHVSGSGNLFRQTLRADWRESREDTEGIRYLLKSAYVQRLGDNKAISYEATSRFNTQPRESWTIHQLNVRYRRNIAYDWMFLETSGYVSFSQEDDWQANPGVRLTLNIVFASDWEI